jgi:hypothetical protein
VGTPACHDAGVWEQGSPCLRSRALETSGDSTRQCLKLVDVPRASSMPRGVCPLGLCCDRIARRILCRASCKLPSDSSNTALLMFRRLMSLFQKSSRSATPWCRLSDLAARARGGSSDVISSPFCTRRNLPDALQGLDGQQCFGKGFLEFKSRADRTESSKGL